MRVSLPRYFRTLRHAPRGARLKLLRKWFESRFSRPSPSTAEVCEFRSIESYEKNYADLAALLGKAGKAPPPNEADFLRRMLHRPDQHAGAIGRDDYFFLTAFASILAPRRVVEVGTLTGFSAAILAAALERQHGHDGDAWVDTIDARERCLIDETRPTGFEIAKLIPEIASMVRLHVPHDSILVRDLAQREELDLIFIDANHYHPRPLLDLLRFAPYVHSGGWIILHDIRLGTVGRQAPSAGPNSPFGAEWLFERWPFRKISGGNIGAVQLPADKSTLIPFALRLMALPSEIAGAPGLRTRSALLQAVADLV